jgi:hypothetical protein
MPARAGIPGDDRLADPLGRRAAFSMIGDDARRARCVRVL